MRPFVQYLAERLGQQIVVDNRGGGGGAMGMEAVAHAAPDGYTIVTALTAQLAVNPALYKKLPYDPIKDLRRSRCLRRAVPAGGSPSLPVKSVKELVEYAGRIPTSSATPHPATAAAGTWPLNC